MAQVIEATAARTGTRVGRLDLVLAVACLGMLAAFALPRQTALTASTHRAEAGALAASVQSAARLGHALWQARGGPATLDVEGGRIRFVNGYPAAADLARLLEPSEAMAFLHVGGAWQHRDRGAGEPCGVQYAPPAAPATEPAVTLRAGGC